MLTRRAVLNLLLSSCAAARWTRATVAAQGRRPNPGEAEVAPDLAQIGHANAWRVINGEYRTMAEGGRRVLELAPIGGNHAGSNLALAVVNGLQFAEGTIDIDLRGNAAGQSSFLGVAFGVTDDKTHEAVYFRPFNFRADDPERRAHGVQYVALPEYPWDRLRAERPGVCEVAIAPVPDPEGWFHARIDLTAARVSVSVDGSPTPCLTVARLARARAGGVGLWVDSQPGHFARFRIRRRR